MEETKFKFRKDIQGLRALAILLVVAAHIKLPFFAGGFIGVDVFFVISGFLISGLILNEINNTSSFNLRQFYAGRFRRLLPPLLLVWLITILVAIFFLSPINQLDQIDSAKFTPLWVSNFYFATWNVDYFGPAAESNLFLHTWSLGVEEQFYLFWPALLLFLLGAWRWQNDRRDIKSLSKSLAIILIIGYLFSLFFSMVQPKFAFYSVFTRVWQFASGGLVYALASSDPRIESEHNIVFKVRTSNYAKVFAILGIVGILSSALIINGKQVYPGYWSLFPTVSTCLVLASCSSPGFKIPFVLGNPIAQFLGKVSYAWYLWHWPVLIIGNLLVASHGFYTRIMLMLFALFLAYLTDQFVEKPIRSSLISKKMPIFVIVIAITLMVLSYNAATYWGTKAKYWSEQVNQQRYSQVRQDMSEIYGVVCDTWFYSSELTPCVLGNPAAKHTIVLLGDSIGAQWVTAVSQSYPVDKWKIIVLTKSACPIADEKIYYERIGRQYIECEFWRKRAIDWIIKNEPDNVIIGSGMNNLTDSQWINGTSRILNRIANATNKIFILVPNPNLPVDGPNCLASREWKPKWAVSKGECEFKLENNRANVRIARLLEIAAEDYKNVHVVNLDEIVCPNFLCSAEENNIIVFRDSQHLTNSFVKSKSKNFAALLNLNEEIKEDIIE